MPIGKFEVADDESDVKNYTLLNLFFLRDINHQDENQILGSYPANVVLVHVYDFNPLRKYHKMVKHTQRICRQIADELFESV